MSAAVTQALPEPLPPGERILWQGAPEPWSLARRAFHLRKVAIYFAILLVWSVATAVGDGASFGAALGAAIGLVPVAAAGLGLVAGIAWLAARTTVYTITDRRVVMRIGIALPMTLNIPFRIVAAAAVRVHSDGTADIPLTLAGHSRAAYLVLWPHARAWCLARPEPMLRSVPAGEKVAMILGDAIAAAPAVPPAASRRPAGLAEPLSAAA